jgi:glycosyltransferase involved in cell wall biosynthesis
MIIIHLCNYFQPKLGYQEYFLAREHARAGHDVTVVTSERYFPFPDYENTVETILGKRIISSGTSELDGFKIIRLKVSFEFSSRVWLMNFKRTIRDIKPDIVICHGMASFNSLRIASLKNKLKFRLIYDDHMLYSEENRSLTGRIFYKLFDFKKISDNADKLVGVSAECKDFIEKKYGFNRDLIRMIPLGADSDVFKFSKLSRTEIRNKYGIKEKTILITYTGKLTFKKGPHNIILAVDLIKEKLTKDIVLLFVGNIETDYKSFFEDHKNKIKNFFQVINIPAVQNSELPDIYSASDIACWPRQGSMSMIEAISCSVPIICCDFLTERYKNNNGIPIKEDNIESLSDAIQKLVNNDNLRSAMGKNGRELIEKEMSWKIIAGKFLE